MPTKNEKNPTPSLGPASSVVIKVAAEAPAAATVGIGVADTGAVPPSIGLSRASLAESGFEGKIGQTLAVPRTDGEAVIAVGLGRTRELDAAKLRDAAAAFGRAAGKHARLATTLADVGSVKPDAAAQAVVEGVLLSRYSYESFKTSSKSRPVEEITLAVPSPKSAAARRGAQRGKVTAVAAQLSRDLSNAPPAYLTATRMAEVATRVGRNSGLKVEVFDKAALQRLGCGGLLGVNAGSAEAPRMIKLSYRPRGARGHLALVGKGIMYDSGGISLKPSDAMHLAMKMDMAGAGAVLSSMSALRELGCKTEVTGYLMCTDNMPSGSATKLGDVLTIRGGTTVEVRNTDAEGRLALADGLVLATEQKPDAIIDIATLTGAMMRALGTLMAGVIGNNQRFVDQVLAAARNTDEAAWQLPLDTRYRSQIDSDIADLNNLGGEQPGAITAALFLNEFVAGIPWAHIDIAGPMKSDTDESWRTKGATGYGARLLIELAMNFTKPRR